MYCLECNETLGKKYIASSPDIDTLRGLYSLSVEKLNRYISIYATISSTINRIMLEIGL